ncbi:LysM peptidoglycan-binding domain-containing protein [Paenibacillus dendritiformis]|uniref:LysM peptidoglycan-binding domain-containing protein n=1 Tax=Paenibacillus dendritiformis TaxID=130049 RepID=UPI000DA72AFB|nr:LysM peptidoglycan-binding domain-containing protein [Paenibacillus dendritiformis]PZM65341.1 peptidoglycan-binding protein LysM [Paenibacillus dendritiformis]
MSYGIQLSFNNKEEVIELPVMPSSIALTEGGNDKVYNVIGLGDINVIKDAKLTEYQFSSIFPAQRSSYVHTEELLSPGQYVEYINRWMRTRHPIRFIVKSDLYDINTPASIESFDWKEVGGTKDIEYSLKLKKYVFYSAKQVKIIKTSAGKTAQKDSKTSKTRPNEKQPPKTYTVQKGDYLWAIAKKTLGDGSRWKEIKNLNNMSDADLKNLKVGRVLKIPGAKK